MVPRMQDETIRQIAEQRADLLAFLQRVGDDGWARPTVCDPWTVKAVLAHLVEGELNLGRIYRGEIREQGYVDPQEGIDRWIALPGVAVRAALWQHGTATQRALDQMTEEVWRSPIKAFGCRTVSRLARLHLFELSMHGYDITHALDAEPTWLPRLPFIVSFVVRAAPLTLRRRAIAPEGALRVICGEDEWTIDGRNGDWALTDTDAPATIIAEPDGLVLGVTGRRPIPELLDASKVAGDADTARRILEGWQVLAQ